MHALRARGDQVAGLDNFNSYYDPALKRLRAQGLPISEGDIADKEQLFAAIEAFKPTHILHLAAQAGVRYSLNHPEAYTHSNVEGFLNILEAARCLDLPLTYASSSSVYGTNTRLPFSEEDPTDSPASLYAATKQANERMARSYHHCYGLKVTGLRYFTVYGPSGRPDMATYSFTDAIDNGRPISLYNNGEMERDFTYIDDIVQGTLAAVDLEAPCEIFNLGGNQAYPVLELVSILEDLLGKKAIIELLPMQPGEVKATYADITKAKKRLGFSPQTPLKEGLTRWMAWYQEVVQSGGVCP